MLFQTTVIEPRAAWCDADMEPGLRVTRVSVSDPLFDPILSFNMHVTVYRGVVSTESPSVL